jgi:hypothetical protein
VAEGVRKLIRKWRLHMNNRERDDALRLLRAARDIHIARLGGDEDSFRAGTTLDLSAAGERTGLPIGYPSHEAAVRWLVSQGAIEPDPMYQNIVGGPIYRITARGVEMLREE